MLPLLAVLVVFEPVLPITVIPLPPPTIEIIDLGPTVEAMQRDLRRDPEIKPMECPE